MAIDAPIHTNEGNLSRVLNAGLPSILVFWRRNCAPCDQLMPILDRFARAYTGRALVVKINAAEETQLLSRYSVTRLPTIVFAKGGQVQATTVGAAAEKDLKAWVEQMLSDGAQPAAPGGPSEPLQTGAGPSTPPPSRQNETARPSSAPPTGAPGPVVLTDENFDMIVNHSAHPVMVDFWAVWCGPCRMVAPVVEQMAQEFAGRAVLGKLNVDENPAIAGRYGIMSIPTLLIFKNGQIADRIVGAQPGQVLRQRLMQQLR